jgi:hypothetical protein
MNRWDPESTCRDTMNDSKLLKRREITETEGERIQEQNVIYVIKTRKYDSEEEAILDEPSPSSIRSGFPFFNVLLSFGTSPSCCLLSPFT